MQLDPGTEPEPEATALAGMTLAQICLDVARKAANAHGFSGEVADDVLTWAIGIDPDLICSLASSEPEMLRQFVQAPNCGHTATTLFTALTSGETFKGVFADLPSHVGRTATDPERTAFRVTFWNHEFVVVVRNGIAEILQSFEREYSLGRYLLERSVSYSPGLLQQYLGNIAAPHVQQVLFNSFNSPLVEGDSRAEYKEARLKSDEDIWRILYEEAIANLGCYQSLRSRPG